jgi:hypothetical protein
MNSEVLQSLNAGSQFHVVYEKLDGTVRSAGGYIPLMYRPQNGPLVSYFDKGFMAMRSFYLDRVKFYETFDMDADDVIQQ